MLPVRQLVWGFQSQDIWGFLFMGYVLLNNGFPYFSETQAFYLILLGILYYGIRILCHFSGIVQLVIVLSLIFYTFGEIVLGFGQMYGYILPHHMASRMTGSFENPESYAGLLACILPLTLSLALRANDAPSKRYYIIPTLSGICTFMLLSLLPASMNPCCWFVAAVGCCLVTTHHFRTFRCYKLLFHRYPKRVVFFTLVFFLLVCKIGNCMYACMENRIENRTGMWEHSLQLIQQSRVHGHGIGSYNQLMSGSKLHPATPVSDSPDIWAADDNSSYCFNEYLRITIENGLAGLLLFLLFIFSAFCRAIRHRQIGCAGSILSFMVFAYYSNIFDILPLSLIFIVILALCGNGHAYLQPHCRSHHAYCSILSQ